MLVVGKVGWGQPLRDSELTPNQHYSHISLWSLLAAPLILGCDLAQLDDFTLALLTNDEVLAVDQDILGKQGRRVIQEDRFEVWVKELADGAKAVGIFNFAPSDLDETAPGTIRSPGIPSACPGRKRFAICGGKRTWVCTRSLSPRT
jgi:hypothetical protein